MNEDNELDISPLVLQESEDKQTEQKKRNLLLKIYRLKVSIKKYYF